MQKGNIFLHNKNDKEIYFRINSSINITGQLDLEMEIKLFEKRFITNLFIYNFITNDNRAFNNISEKKNIFFPSFFLNVRYYNSLTEQYFRFSVPLSYRYLN